MTAIQISDSYIQADLIQLRGNELSPPLDLIDGEGYLDEGDQTLTFKFLNNPGSLILGVSAVAPLSGKADEVCMRINESEVDFRPLTLGGGGQAFDPEPFRVPGLFPVSAGTMSITTAGYRAPFTLQKPATVTVLQLGLTTNGDVTFGIETSAGVVLSSNTFSFTAGDAYQKNVSVVLAPGAYRTFVTPTATITARQVSGHHQNGALVAHPVHMRFA